MSLLSTNQTIEHPQIGDLYWMTVSVNLIELNMGTVHTVAVHFRYDWYMRRLANEFLCRNPIEWTKRLHRNWLEDTLILQTRIFGDFELSRTFSCCAGLPCRCCHIMNQPECIRPRCPRPGCSPQADPNYMQSRCNSCMYSQTFFPSAVRLWNRLTHATFHVTASSRSCRRLISSDHAPSFYLNALRAKLRGAVYCNWSCLWVCLFVGLLPW